jgi:hypothetical protein
MIMVDDNRKRSALSGVFTEASTALTPGTWSVTQSRRAGRTWLVPTAQSAWSSRFRQRNLPPPSHEPGLSRTPFARQLPSVVARPGFDVSGRIALADIMGRVGAGECRVSACGFNPRGLRWEGFVRRGEEAS